MTCFTYGLMSFRHSKLVSNKQTNVYEVEECFKLVETINVFQDKGLMIVFL